MRRPLEDLFIMLFFESGLYPCLSQEIASGLVFLQSLQHVKEISGF